MTDNYNNNNENQPVNGEYHYRTYDLENRQKPVEPQSEPQASFGSGEWQWQPAEPQPEPKKKRKIKWGRFLLSAVGVVLAAALCFTAGYAGVLVANQKNTVVIQQVMPGNSSGPEAPTVDNTVLTSAQVAAKSSTGPPRSPWSCRAARPPWPLWWAAIPTVTSLSSRSTRPA